MAEPPGLSEWAAQQQCPVCALHGFLVEMRMVASPLATFSLAGQQMKFSAREVPYLVCQHCGVETRGEWTTDG